MDKDFWVSITKSDYEIPAGNTLEELTKTLLGHLGSTDTELRDDIAYTVYANWLKREMYTKDQVRAHVEELLGNVDKGIGETVSDSVFLQPSLFYFSLKSFTTTTKNGCSKRIKSNPFLKKDYGISMRKKIRAGMSRSKAGRTRLPTPLT